MRIVFLVLFLVLEGVVFASNAGAQHTLNLMPMPAQMQPATGQLVIDPSFSVAIAGYKDARLQGGVDRFLADLRRQTGMVPLDLRLSDAATAKFVIEAERNSKEIPELGEDESYSLEITPSGAKLNAPNTLGILHGLQTFLQLVQNTPAGFVVPALVIHDQPRFPWRGLMIDVGRHFIPLDILKRNLDGMAAVKLNVLHWHLSENQGFRIESKKFPKLQEMGSDGLYYTQEEVRELIAYAGERGIRVIPEFDMPGHSTAWFVGYPELASGKGPYPIERRWGVFDPAMDPTQEHTYKFLDEFIGEMAKLFPDRYFHIGGDEVNGKEWDANPRIQEFMHSHGLKNNDELQAYFNQHVQAIVSKHGKIMMGWDEILKPDLPKEVVVQSWRGAASLAQAAREGHGAVLSSGYYLDLMQPASQHYAVDPMAGEVASLSPEQQRHILGGEACMWAEFVSPENIDSRIWPRAAAIAERLWSPQTVNDVDSMYRRMVLTGDWLSGLGLSHDSGYEPMLQRIAGSEDAAGVRTLADVVEPVKQYARSDQAVTEPTSLMPLNRLVDAARPESLTARHFSALVDGLLSGQTRPGVEPELRAFLVRWRDNDAGLQAAGEQSFLIPEILPLSQDLSALGAAGLEALDFLDRGEPAPENWKSAQLARIEEAEKPKAQLLLMIASPVRKLVEASAKTITK